MRLLVAASAALLAAAPALAQASAVPAGRAEAEPRMDFAAVQKRLKAELTAAYEAAGRDKAAAAPALDAIVSRYQPHWDVFALEEEARFKARVARAPAGERDEMRRRAAPFFSMIRSGPSTFRGDLERNGTLISPAPPPPPPRPR